MGVHIGGAWGMATALTALLQGPFMGPQAGRARLEGGVGPVGEGLDLAPVRNNLLELESTRAVGRRVLDVGAATSGELRAEHKGVAARVSLACQAACLNGHQAALRADD